MKKKNIIISISTIVAVSLITVGILFLLSFHKVTFDLKNDTTGITVYDSKGKEKKKLTGQKTSILLQDGSYYLVPEGKNIATEKITFTVEKRDTTITVDPPFSEKYLGELLKNEQGAIAAAIAAKYPTLINNYTLKSETLYKRGDWFGGLLAPKVSDARDERDTYRIVLHKQNDTWTVIRRPEYVLTSSRFKEVPIDVLRAINAKVE